MQQHNYSSNSNYQDDEARFYCQQKTNFNEGETNINWQSIFDYLIENYEVNPIVLKGDSHKLTNYLTTLVRSASKRIIWALSMPNNNDELKNLTLYTLSYLYQKNQVPMLAYFDIEKSLNNYIRKLDWQNFNFLLVDNFLMLEHPNPTENNHKHFYCIKNFSIEDLSTLMDKSFLNINNLIKQELVKV